MNIRLLCLFLMIIPLRVIAQETLQAGKNENYYDLSLEELMNIKISVASVKELTPRESPGIVTLITSDDIKNLGARDLMDVLKVVPGFDFGVDVEGVVGIGVRGNWAHEGKILLLIDGQQMNENLYSTIQLGNHYPVDNIERIEIIRGPGSAIYGDCAEYAVINIINRKAQELKGLGVSAFYGQTGKSSGHRYMNVSLGEEQKDFSYTFSGYVAEANRSTGMYTDVYGDNYDMTTQSQINNENINLGVNIKDFQFRGIIDKYNLQTRDAYQEILSKPYPISFDSYFFELKKENKINGKLTLTPKINYKNQVPWAFDDLSNNDEFERYKIVSQQYTGNLTAVYDFNSHLNFIAGSEYIKNIATQKTGNVFQTSGTDHLSYENAAAFAQAILRMRFATFTAGARYNYNNLYSASFVPRFCITKTVNKLHLKLLFSKAFRAPNTENIDLNPNIKPESTNVFEAEAGYQINHKMMLTLNAFDISTKDQIVYYYDGVNNKDAYLNYQKTGTRGFEIEYKYKSRSGYLGCNYAFYIPFGNALSGYAVPDNPDALLAFSPHKINFTSGIKIFKHIKLNSSLCISGPRYGIVAYNENTSDTTIKKFNPAAIVNLNISYDNLLLKGLTASIGANNLFDTKDYYIQPYNNLHAPLPSNGREFALKISYAINFKQQ
ncbi:MAG: TonB-dependent receptor plug domain-containing protein [Bacteroidota bacterium]